MVTLIGSTLGIKQPRKANYKSN